MVESSKALFFSSLVLWSAKHSLSQADMPTEEYYLFRMQGWYYSNHFSSWYFVEIVSILTLFKFSIVEIIEFVFLGLDYAEIAFMKFRANVINIIYFLAMIPISDFEIKFIAFMM